MKRLFAIVLALVAVSASAYNYEFALDVRDMEPVVLDVYHGEDLRLKPDFTENGETFSLQYFSANFYWQTNGMDDVYFVTNATIEAVTSITWGTVYECTVNFTRWMDPGADVCRCFIQLTSTATETSGDQTYRAYFLLRFHGSPGATPNAITKPPRVLDFTDTTVVNPPWPSMQDLANATNGVSGIITNHVESGYLCTVAHFEENADYALTNVTGAAVTLTSGEIASVSLASSQTSFEVTLDFSAATDRSGDAMVYLVNAADVSLGINPAPTTIPVGYDLSTAIGAGTNVLMFTRVKLVVEGTTPMSTVLVTVKEL